MHLVNFVITTLFEALVSAVYSTQRKEQLDVWFKTYRLVFNNPYLHSWVTVLLLLLLLLISDMMVLPTMKQYLHMYMGLAEMKCVEVKLHVMQATFLTARSCPAVNQEALVMAAQTFQTLFGRYFKENAEVSIVEVFSELLPQYSLNYYFRCIFVVIREVVYCLFKPILAPETAHVF